MGLLACDGCAVASGAPVQSAVVEAVSAAGRTAALARAVLLAKATGCVDHFEGCLDCPVKGIPTCLGRRALVHEICEH